MPDASLANEGAGATLRFQKVSAVLYALMLVLGGWTYVAWILAQDYDATLETSRRRVEQFARGLGLQVEAMAFDGLGSATIGAALVGSGVDKEATAALGSGYTRALFIVDGPELTITQSPEEDLASLTGSFMSALLASDEPAWVGPMVDTPSGKAFAVAQRTMIRGREVWAGAWLSSRNFEKFFSDPNKPDSYLALTTLDGVILGRFPPRQEEGGKPGIDDSAVRSQLRSLPARTTAFLRGSDTDDGGTFDYGAYRLAGLPLVAVAGRTRHDAAAAWRPRRNKTVLFAALTSVVVLGFAVLLQLAFNRSLRNAQALAQARRSELEAKESLANELMLAQDAERKRLAGELHDGIGQTLSLLRNQVLLLRRIPLPPQAGDKAQNLLELSSEAIEDLRSVARSLRPMHLEEQGVTGALRSMLGRVRTSSGLVLDSRVEEVDDVITGSDATHLYRIAQEVVSNVIKHAEAKHLSIEIIRDIDMVELQVRDDGKGMPSGAGNASKGIGLLSIGERCRMLGATLAITANQPSGTSVLVRVPIRSYEEARA